MKRTLSILPYLFIFFAEVNSQCYCEDCPVNIVNNGVTSATMNVAGAVENMLGTNGQDALNVHVTFETEAIKELQLRLFAPNGSFVELTSDIGINVGPLAEWDIDFVRCVDLPFPDPMHADQFDSNETWHGGGPYFGSYHPEVGCLEDLTGQVNGLWTLEITDGFFGDDGIVFCFSVEFVNPSGIICEEDDICPIISNCQAEGGNTVESLFTEEVGSPNLDLNVTVEFIAPATPAPSPEYVYLWLVFEPLPSGLLIGILTDPDFTSFAAGEYLVYGISILATEVGLLPTPFDGSTYDDIVNSIINDPICADFDDTGFTVIITDDCLANAGILPQSALLFCEGAPELNVDLTPTYTGGDEPPSPEYTYTYILNIDGVVDSYINNTDFSTYPPGTYEVCGLSILTADLPVLPSPDGSLSIADIEMDILDDIYCADVTDACVTIYIDPMIDIVWEGPETVCAGEEVFYTITNYDPALDPYLYNITMGSFLQFVDLGGGVLSVIWDSAVPIAELCVSKTNACGTVEVCKTIEVSEPPSYWVIGEPVVCTGDTEIYIINPPLEVGQSYDIIINGGTLLSQNEEEIIVNWTTTVQGEICIQLINDPGTDFCDIDEVCLPVIVNEPPLSPIVPVFETGCIDGSVTYLASPTDPSITDYIWTVTNASIINQNEEEITIAYTNLGLVEICLEVITDCGNLGPDCYETQVYPNPDPTIINDGPYCVGVPFTINGTTDIGDSFLWTTTTGNDAILSFSTPSEQSTEVTVSEPGVFAIFLTVSTDYCSDIVTDNLEVLEGPEIDNLIPLCNAENTHFVVSFSILGPNTPFLVNGVMIAGNSYTSSEFASGDNYVFEIEDGNGCITIIDGSFLCECTSDAGTMPADQLEFCIENSPSTILTIPTDAFLDGNDLGCFYLHTSSGNSLGTVLDVQCSGAFVFDVSQISTDVTYYISYVVGNETLSGEVDIADECTVVSIGQPIVFYLEPFVDAGENLNVCGLVADIGANANTFGDWDLITGPPGGMATISGLPGAESVAVNMAGVYIFGLTIPLLDCPGEDEVEVTFLEEPMAIDLNTICDGDTYILSFAISGGTAPYFVDGVLISSNTFSSTPQMSGVPVFFTVTDENGCLTTNAVGGVENCNCTTNAGTMPQDTLKLCGELGVTFSATTNGDAIFDSNDVGSYYFHDGSLNILGAVFDTSRFGNFEFDSYNYNTVYYISYVVGSEFLNGQVDLDDDCLSVSIGQPVLFFEAPQIDAGSYDTICSYDFLLVADNGGVSGLWSIDDFPTGASPMIDDLSNPNAVFITDQPGIYSVRWTSTNSFCPAVDVAVIDIDSIFEITSSLALCNDNLESYTILVKLAGGQKPYFIDGVIVDSVFNTPNIPSGDFYDYLITDSNGCKLILQGSTDCGCQTYPGTMNQDTLNVCVPNQNLVVEYNGDSILDNNDSGQFILHTSNADTIGQIIVISDTNFIPYNPTIVFDSVYFVSFIVGDSLLNGMVDLTDDCLGVAIGQPVIFMDGIEIISLPDTSVCGNEFLIINETLNSLNINFLSSPPGGTVGLSQVGSDIQLTVDSFGIYEVELSKSNGLCSLSDTFSIAYVERMSLEIEEICNPELTYNVILTFSNGISPYFVNGVELASNIFISDSLPSGDLFSFTTDDSSPCSGLNIAGTKNCDCPNDAGSMNTDTVSLCEGFALSMIYSNDDYSFGQGDTIRYILHDGNGPLLGNILYISKGEDILFQPNFLLETIYYLSTVSGPTNPDGSLILNDVCTNVAVGTPVIWNSPISLIIDDFTVCDTTLLALPEITYLGPLPLSVTVRDQNGDIQTFISEDGVVLPMNVNVSSVFEILSINGLCSTFPDPEFAVNVNFPLEFSLVDQTVCNEEGTSSFIPLATLFEGGTIVLGVWTIAPAGEITSAGIDMAGVIPGVYDFIFEALDLENPCIPEMDTVSISVEDCPCPQIDFGDDIELCNNISFLELPELLVSGNQGSFFQIIDTPPGENPANIFEVSFLINGRDAGTYTVVYNETIIDIPDGCEDSDTILITLQESVNAGTQVGEYIICEDETEMIDLETLLMGTPHEVYFFDANFEELPSSIINTSILVDGLNVFKAIAPASLPCENDTADILIVFEANLPVDVTVQDINCIGDSDGRILIVDPVNGDYDYSIDGMNFTDANIFEDLSAGIYTLYIRSKASGCVHEEIVTIDQLENGTVSLGDDISVNNDEQVNIAAITSLDTILDIEWQTLQSILNDTTLAINTSFVADNQVSITLTDVNGCSISDTLLVFVKKGDFVFPNIINLNSTSGNSTFSIINKNGIQLVNNLQIFDRWGAQVFNLENVTPDLAYWDGTKNGRLVNQGVYVYLLEITTTSNSTQQFIGDITVLRN